MNTLDFTPYHLGTDNHLLAIDRLIDHQRAAVHLVQQAKREVILCSRSLDPFIYHQHEFRDALQQVILNQPRVNIKLLVFETDELLHHGHLLLTLARRLSSFFTVRLASQQHQQYNQSLLLVDNTGYLHRHYAARYKGQLNFNDRQYASALRQEFDTMWDEARPDSNLRRFLI